MVLLLKKSRPGKQVCFFINVIPVAAKLKKFVSADFNTVLIFPEIQYTKGLTTKPLNQPVGYTKESILQFYFFAMGIRKMILR